MTQARSIAVACLLGASVWLGFPGGTGRAAEAEADKRFPVLKMEELNDLQRPVGEAIVKVSSNGLAGPYSPMLRSPVFADRMVKLLDYLRFNSSVPRRLNEFAILITAREWTSQIEWFAHQPMAIKAGLAQSITDDLKAGRRPAGMQPDEAAVYDLITELHTTHQLSEATFRRVKGVLGEQQVIDLIATSGTYVTVAMILATADENPPNGARPLQPLAAT